MKKIFCNSNNSVFFNNKLYKILILLFFIILLFKISYKNQEISENLYN